MPQYVMPISKEMKANIDLILNNTSPNIPNFSVINITKRPEFGSYILKCKLIGDNRVTGEQFEVEPLEVSKLAIDQNFMANYTDNISLKVMMTPVQYLQLYDNSRGLKCSITMTPAHLNTVGHASAPTIIREYLAVFKEKMDLRKRFSKEALIANKVSQHDIDQQSAIMPDVEFQLISQDAYNLRKVKLNFITRQVTVKDVLLLICKLCNITKAAIVEPDNTKTYENFVIPPNMTMEEAIQHIQNYYGIYNKGVGFYYTDEVLYVYPLYETHPTTPESAHLYYVGSNYTGLDVAHAMSDSITHIVLTDFAHTKDFQDSGVENIGTTVIIQDASRVIDQATTISEGSGTTGLGQVSVNELNTSVFSPGASDVGMVYDAYQPMFKFDNCNPYRVRTDLNSYRTVMVTTKWHAAVPYTFKPGYHIYYHYDGQNIRRRDQEEYVDPSSMYTTKSGIVMRATYNIFPSGKHANIYRHTCECDIALSIENAPANEEPKGDQISEIDPARTTREAAMGGGDVKALAGIIGTYKGSDILAAADKIKSAGLF